MGPHYDEAIRQQETIAKELARLDRRRPPLAETSPKATIQALCVLALLITVPVIALG